MLFSLCFWLYPSYSFVELLQFREYCQDVPCVLVANKIDVDYNVTRKEFKFASKHNLPFFFVSAADGTNVVKVFQSAILEAKRFKESGGSSRWKNDNGFVCFRLLLYWLILWFAFFLLLVLTHHIQVISCPVCSILSKGSTRSVKVKAVTVRAVTPSNSTQSISYYYLRM